MIRKFAETVVGGAIGLIALYVVAHVAYEAGCEMTKTELRYQQLQAENRAVAKEKEDDPQLAPPQEPMKIAEEKKSRLGRAVQIAKLFAGKRTMLGRLVRNPEGHKIEALVEGDELHINVKRKEASFA